MASTLSVNTSAPSTTAAPTTDLSSPLASPNAKDAKDGKELKESSGPNYAQIKSKLHYDVDNTPEVELLFCDLPDQMKEIVIMATKQAYNSKMK